MHVAHALRAFLPGLDGPTNAVRSAWDRLSPLPGGARAFSHLVGLMAPYSATVGARVIELKPGFARVVLADRRAVRNHIRCVHAIALANLAELTGNLALAYAQPDDARFIVAGLSMDYVKKARGTIVATSECPIPATSQRREYEVPVELRDDDGVLVARCLLRTLVGPKRS